MRNHFDCSVMAQQCDKTAKFIFKTVLTDKIKLIKSLGYKTLHYQW